MPKQVLPRVKDGLARRFAEEFPLTLRLRRQLVFLVMTLLTVVAIPQTAAAQHVGYLVGFNFANVDLDIPDLPPDADRSPLDGDSAAGFVGGLTFHHLATDMLGFEVDVLISMKGTQELFPTGGHDGTMTAAYLDVPLLGRVNVPVDESHDIHVLLGPSLNFNVSDSFDADNPGGGDDVSFKRFETALVFGGGVTINRFRIDARYSLGLTSVIDEDQYQTGYTGTNKVLGILFGVELR